MPLLDPTKPKYIDPRFPAKLRPLADSLMAFLKVAPDSLIYERPSQAKARQGLSVLADYNSGTRAMRLSPSAPNPRRQLTHEFGHVLNFDNSPLFYDWFDPTSQGKNPTVDDLERFADTFADVYEARGDTTKIDKEAKMLYRILGRLKNEQK